MSRRILIIRLVTVLFFCLLLLQKGYSFANTFSSSTVDHSKLSALNKDFERVEEVTKTCLECHNLAAKQFKNTLHWTWEVKFNERRLGKRHVINNY